MIWVEFCIILGCILIGVRLGGLHLELWLASGLLSLYLSLRCLRAVLREQFSA